MSNKTTYKTPRKYKCPYCDVKALRSDLIDHVDKKHADLIPEGYTSDRVVYDSVNRKNYGICMICKAKVYKWNDKIGRYYNLCDKPSCREEVRRIALERHMRVYNKPTLLDDPEHQEKMLANRKISGSYTFTDGGKVTYTGSYEKKTLEFMDKVLEIPSKDIQAPGPVLEYEYNGEIHKWITDIYYIPANLLIEVKDGGNNPNKRSMPSYREKQVAKETMITNLGTFNYLRLTNNDFSQLLTILADIKNDALIGNDNKSIKINEEVGGLPVNRPPEAYVVPYGMNNVFSGFAYGDSDMSDMLITDDAGDIISIAEQDFYNQYETGLPLYYAKPDIRKKMSNIAKSVQESKNKKKSMLYFAEMLIGRDLYRYEEIFLTDCFKYYDKDTENMINAFIENSILRKAENITEGAADSTNVIDTEDNVMICQSPRGYYAQTSNEFSMSSEYFSDIDSLKDSGVIDLMNNIYIKNAGKDREEDEEDDAI